MTLGAVQNVLICQPAGSQAVTTVDQQVCPAGADGTVYKLTSVQAYLVDPSQGSQLDVATAPFDYSLAAGFWMAAFTSVVMIWFASHNFGAILQFFRRN